MEVINSFFSNIKDKLTNPFFGTLILVLLIHHWELIYGIFNFDSDFTLTGKLSFIQNYINKNLTLGMLFYDLLYASGAMILGYLIIVGTRSIVLALEYRIMPFLTGKIVSKNVVVKSLYDEAAKEREEYFDQYEEQRKNVRDFSKTIDEQTEQIKEKNQDYLEQSKSLDKSVKDLETLNKRFMDLDKKSNQDQDELKKIKSGFDALTDQYQESLDRISNYKSLFFGDINKGYYTRIEKFSPRILSKVNELKSENLWEDFTELEQYAKRGGKLNKKIIDKMAEKGIIDAKMKHHDWTPIGEILLEYKSVFDESKESS